MLTTETLVRSRYPDCDRMGVVHHAVYPVWYELARMDWLERAGLTFRLLQSLGVNPTMVDLHIRYLAPVTYPQAVTIRTHLGQYAPKKLELIYTLTTDQGVLAGEATTFHIWTGPDNRAYDLEKYQPEVYGMVVSSK